MKKMCEGCEHLRVKISGYCYMFEHPPNDYCAQHTKYKKIREKNGKLLGELIRKKNQLF